MDRVLLGEDVRPFSGNTIHGYTVRIKRERADKFNMSNIQHFGPSPGSPICPVAVLDRYFVTNGAHIKPRLPFFFSVDRGGVIKYVSSADVTDVLKRVAPEFGLDPAFHSAASLRTGGAFLMADNGASLELVQQRGRWSAKSFSEIVLMYERFSERRLHQVSEAFAPRESFPLVQH